MYFKEVRLFKFPPILKCTLFHFLALNDVSADNSAIEVKIAQCKKSLIMEVILTVMILVESKCKKCKKYIIIPDGYEVEKWK